MSPGEVRNLANFFINLILVQNMSSYVMLDTNTFGARDLGAAGGS